jgi:hypothetical protein
MTKHDKSNNLLIDKTAKIVANDVITSFEKFDFWVDERLPENFISKNEALKIITDKYELEKGSFIWETIKYKRKEISITIQWYDEVNNDLCVLLGNDKHQVYNLNLVI